MADEQQLPEGEQLEGEQKPTGEQSQGGEQQQAPEIELTDEQLLARINAKTGREFKSLDEFKPTPEEPSEDEKRFKASTEDLKMAERFVKKYPGTTAEGYYALKNVAEADVKEFSLADTKAEMKKAGFSEDEIDDVLKARYFLMDEEELADLSDADQDLIKKNKFFSNKLETKGEYKIKQAKDVLAGLKADMEAENYEKEVDAKLSATVVEIAEKMDRKLTFDLGKSNDLALPPVEYTLDEAEVKELTELLGDKAKREQFLYNQDGSENVHNLFEALKYKVIAQKMAKKIYLDGHTEAVNFFQTKFPQTASAVAPGFVPKTGRGAEAGKAIEGTGKTKVAISQ